MPWLKVIEGCVAWTSDPAGKIPWCVSVSSQASLPWMCTGLKLTFPFHGLKCKCISFTYNCRWLIYFFSLPFKSSYSKVTFDYLINMQYIEHLEGFCFLGVLSVRFGDFCLLGFFLLNFFLSYVLLHIECGTLSRFCSGMQESLICFWNLKKNCHCSF